jgi:YfiH family protein
MHVGDDPERVVGNRDRLARFAGIGAQPGWLEQVHGTVVADFDAADPKRHRVPPTADASMTSRPGRICVVMTADCLPILLTDVAGTAVAATHGGWRGLAAGVVEATVAGFRERGVEASQLLAWLGPAISPGAYEVDRAVARVLGPEDSAALLPGRPGRWQLDLYGLARGRLKGCGIERIYGGDRCTHAEASRFFSYRRDGVTGRQATLIWLERQRSPDE